MPLHDVGYRPWRGRVATGSAAGVIALTGIKLAWKSRWLRRAVLFAWTPGIVFAFAFFAFEQAVEDGLLGPMRPRLRLDQAIDNIGALGTVIANALGGRPSADGPTTDELRHIVWSRLLLAFMRAPQALLLAIVVGLVAPALVSRDLRAKAWLVYFTRPVREIDYIVGKLVVLAMLVAAITMLPALALWVLGVLVSPSLQVVLTTWDLPLRIVVSALTLALPTVLMALAYSSLTLESRIASFAWFATWGACWVAHGALTTADMMAAEAVDRVEASAYSTAMPLDDDLEQRSFPGRAPPRRRPPPEPLQWLRRAGGIDARPDRWAWLSPYHALGVVQAAVFGIERRPDVIIPPVLSLSVLSLVAGAVLVNRVGAPARV
ncbi:MAG: hypothetical protein FJ309_07070 [Planctomycetes bacterium]|nr:hypothetical protein [Planctomycetota bacterium]